MWIGIDVGGRTKGFHFAAISADFEVTLGNACDQPVQEVTEWMKQFEPVQRIAVDAPPDWAVDGEPYRACERKFLDEKICNIFYTPTQAIGAARSEGRGDGYYDWIAHGIELWRRLADDFGREKTIECFPTASLTRWGGPRRDRSRARWSKAILASCWGDELDDVSKARNQDQRDAVAAALTAWQFDIYSDTVEFFGPLHVPRYVPEARPGAG